MYFNFSNLLEENSIVTYQISNQNIIYSPQKPRKSSSLPLKSSSWLFSLNAGKVFISLGIILPSAHKMQVKFRSHFSEKKVRLMGREIQYINTCASKQGFLDTTHDHKTLETYQHINRVYESQRAICA